jgi:Domain of unknown function (DUF4149)
MFRLFAFLTLLAWALWLGGLITLFICVITLFSHNRTLAVDSAPVLFVNFERYQLILAAVALTCTVVWRVMSKNLVLNLVFLLLCLSSLGAIASPLYFSKQMERLREEGKTNSPKFEALHRQSEWVYTSEATLLLISGLPLFVALRRANPAPQTEKASGV